MVFFVWLPQAENDRRAIVPRADVIDARKVSASRSPSFALRLFVYEKRWISPDFGLPITIGCEASHRAGYVFADLQKDHKIQQYRASDTRC